MVPVAEIVHTTDARVRVKVPFRKKDQSYFSALAQKLEEHQDVETVHVNPRLGTALISHTSSVSKIGEYAAKEGLFQLRTAEPTPQTIFEHFRGAVDGWSHTLQRYTGGRLDMASLVFIVLLGAGVYQLMKGNVKAPAWYTAFWYALGVFSKGYHGPGVPDVTSEMSMDIDGDD